MAVPSLLSEAACDKLRAAVDAGHDCELDTVDGEARDQHPAPTGRYMAQGDAWRARCERSWGCKG